MDNEKFIGVEDSKGNIDIFSLIAIRAFSMVRQNKDIPCYTEDKVEILREIDIGGDLLIVHGGDEIDLGTDDAGNRVYGIVTIGRDGVWFEYKEVCNGSNLSEGYKKYKKIADKYAMAGIKFNYRWMENGYYLYEDLRGKIFPGCVLLTEDIEYSRNADKFEEMAWIDVNFTDVSLNIGTLINCFYVEASDFMVSIDELIFGLDAYFEASVLKIGRLMRSTKLKLKNSELQINKAGCINSLTVTDSRVEIHEIERIQILYTVTSEIVLDRFKCLELRSGGRQVRIVFNNPLELGEMVLSDSPSVYRNVSFEFPNGAPLDKLGPILSSLIERRIAVCVIDKDYETLINWQGKSEYLRKIGVNI